jgi:hypothetical protein
MTFEEAVEYTRIPTGTFRKLSANGTFTAHGGKRKVDHRQECLMMRSASIVTSSFLTQRCRQTTKAEANDPPGYSAKIISCEVGGTQAIARLTKYECSSV